MTLLYMVRSSSRIRVDTEVSVAFRSRRRGFAARQSRPVQDHCIGWEWGWVVLSVPVTVLILAAWSDNSGGSITSLLPSCRVTDRARTSHSIRRWTASVAPVPSRRRLTFEHSALPRRDGKHRFRWLGSSLRFSAQSDICKTTFSDEPQFTQR